MTNQPKTELIQIRVSPSTKRQLRSVAEKLEMSQSEVVRALVEATHSRIQTEWDPFGSER